MTTNDTDLFADEAPPLDTEGERDEILRYMDVIDGLRLEHGLTQVEFADRCGIDQGDISRIERGATSPTVRTLQRIAEHLNADLQLVPRAS